MSRKGDYLRYKSEYTHPNKTDTNSANLAYESSKRLPATSTIRLGLALSYSTMVYEILHDDKSAIKIAKDAFDAAIVELDSLNDNDFRDATLIMQLLRDNLTLWTPAEDDIKPS
ncbi:hypothetical protein LOD99_10812 [Oopsacas minuta]|uniref:14-3-3 domain-containing protein n=1 Tax=Oopsacas minuta TaxID=111878 RepID=A0AAV7KEV0_9METZ|nr:hypothetical protein LOD99_10812 [Oopsacas minuta]